MYKSYWRPYEWCLPHHHPEPGKAPGRGGGPDDEIYDQLEVYKGPYQHTHQMNFANLQVRNITFYIKKRNSK